MTEWMLRRQGGRAVGPVPTRALIRGIQLGKVPRDTEAREVAGGTWMPLASYDEFYDAMGLDDDATRVVETPWFARRTASAEPNSRTGSQPLPTRSWHGSWSIACGITTSDSAW